MSVLRPTGIMKYFYFVMLLAASALSLSATAQTGRWKITGSLFTADKQSIEAATITLLKRIDSSTVKVSVSDKAGRFEFEDIPEGKYIVSISAVGYESTLFASRCGS